MLCCAYVPGVRCQRRAQGFDSCVTNQTPHNENNSISQTNHYSLDPSSADVHLIHSSSEILAIQHVEHTIKHVLFACYSWPIGLRRSLEPVTEPASAPVMMEDVIDKVWRRFSFPRSGEPIKVDTYAHVNKNRHRHDLPRSAPVHPPRESDCMEEY